MSFERLRHRLAVLVGSDVLVSFDDDQTPSRILLFRQDAVSDDLMGFAIRQLVNEFPTEMGSITDVTLSFQSRLGLARRRFALN